MVLTLGCGSTNGDGSPSAMASSSGVPRGAGAVLEAAENERAPARSSTAMAAADPMIVIPAGAFVAGSTPGDPGRDPTLEATLLDRELGAFDIDRFLYPNQIGEPPLALVTREKAQALCKTRSRRLCTELEWERACKGPDNQPYAGNEAWDPACGKDPPPCASGFGVVGMGALREWTASDLAVDPEAGARAVVRGGASDAAATDHRCARRSAVSPEAASCDLGFRCCGGAANEATLPSPAEKPAFGPADLPAAELARIFAGVSQLAKLGSDLKYYETEAAQALVVQRSDGGITKGYELVTTPLAWSPVKGEALVVVAGLAGEDSFIVALYALPAGRYRVASSLILRKDSGPIVIAYDRSVAGRLEWSTCWQCRGESGRITYRDDRRVVITQE